MLNPSSPTQKNPSEEDSCGSDAGSGVGLEPETDRFGFIVTNKSTAGRVGPTPELVRHREAKWINIIVQWESILLKKTNKVKVQCQKGIPASLRAKCWPLLCGATHRMKQRLELYKFLDSLPALQNWVDVIERDLDRQFPFHEMFLSKDGHGQRGLFRVLKAYTHYKPEEGYCQAQGPVAAVLLMNMPAEEAFWCLVQISEQYLPGYYSPLLEGVLFDAAMLTWVLKRTCPAAQKHLEHHGVEPLMFATDWLMCLFTRHLPFNTLLRVWDLFFCYGVRVLLQVAVVLVRRVLGRAEQRKQCQGQMETLERLRGVREQVQEEDDVFIAEVCSVPLSGRDLEKQTEKEIEKWRKEKPSSTFDPRRRCLGYRMAWATAQQNQEEQEKKDREKSNLSLPLTRSASTLSLSPSSICKRWGKGGKGNSGEWESGSRVVRHLSMGAKEDWRSWCEVNLKKVQVVQEEETVSDKHKKQSRPKLTEQTEPKHLDNIQSKASSEETKGKDEKTEATKDQTVENTLQPTEHTALHKQGEELDSHPQVVKQQSYISSDPESEVKDGNKASNRHKPENEPISAVEEPQTEIQKDTDVDTNTELKMEGNVQQAQVDTVAESSETTDTRPRSGTERQVETLSVKNASVETETQQEVITDSSQGDTFKGQQSCTESLAETDMEKESHTQTVSEAGVETQEKADVLVETGEKAEVLVETGEKAEVLVETGEKVDVLVETGEKSDVLVGTGEKADVLVETGEKADVLVETGEKSDVLVETGEKAEVLVETGEKAEVLVETGEKVDVLVETGEKSDVLVETGEKSDVLVETREKADVLVETGEKADVLVETGEKAEVLVETGEKAEVLVETGEKAEVLVETGEKADILVETGEKADVLVETGEKADILVETGEKADVLVETGEKADVLVETGEKADVLVETGEKADVLVETGEKSGVLVETGEKVEVLVETGEKADILVETGEKVEVLVETGEKADLLVETGEKSDVLVETGEKSDVLVETGEKSDVLVETGEKADVLVETGEKADESNQTKESTDFVSETETEAEIPVSNDRVSESSAPFAGCSDECDLVASEPTKEKDERFLADKDQTQAVETQKEIHMWTSGSVAPPQKEGASHDEEVNFTTEPDVKMSSAEINTPKEPAPEQPKIVATMCAVEEESQETAEQNTVGEDDVFISTKITAPNTDSNPKVQSKESHPVKDHAEMRSSSLTQASGYHSNRSSGDFCIRRSSTSHGSRLGRRLSEDLFTTPQKTGRSQPSPNQPGAENTESQSSPGAVHQDHSHPDVTQSPGVTSSEASEGTGTQQEPPNPPKRFDLFRRLRAEQPKKNKSKGTPKMQVPKILIQDFSDGTGVERSLEEDKEEKLSSKERRRRKRERERRAKEEERLRKKREKELEKVAERERRKPQTRGKSFQVQRENERSDEPQPAKAGSQTLRYSASYAESYF